MLHVKKRTTLAYDIRTSICQARDWPHCLSWIFIDYQIAIVCWIDSYVWVPKHHASHHRRSIFCNLALWSNIPYVWAIFIRQHKPPQTVQVKPLTLHIYENVNKVQTKYKQSTNKVQTLYNKISSTFTHQKLLNFMLNKLTYTDLLTVILI